MICWSSWVDAAPYVVGPHASTIGERCPCETLARAALAHASQRGSIEGCKFKSGVCIPLYYSEEKVRERQLHGVLCERRQADGSLTRETHGSLRAAYEGMCAAQLKI